MENKENEPIQEENNAEIANTEEVVVNSSLEQQENAAEVQTSPEVVTEVVLPAPQPAAQPKADDPKKMERRGSFIAALVCFIFAVITIAVSYYVVLTVALQVTSGANDVGKAVGIMAFILFAVTIGWVTFIPGLVLSIVSTIMSVRCWRSTKKAYRVAGIIIFILSMLLLLALVGVIALFMIPGA